MTLLSPVQNLSVGRSSKIIPSGGKRLVQTLISDVAKKMRMSSNLAKRKREEEEPAHWEEKWEGGTLLKPQ